MPAPTMTRFSRPLLPLILLLGCQACSGWHPAYRSPEVQLTGIEVERLRLDAQQLRVSLQLDNPGSLPLPLYSLDYRLFVDQTLLGEGFAQPDLLIAPGSSQHLALPLRASLWPVMRQLSQSLRHQQPIAWRLEADIQTGALFGPVIPLRRSGTFSPDQPMKSLHGIP